MKGDQRRLSVVLVGQVPPPYTGQTIMTDLTVQGRYPHADMHHVPTEFSRSLAEMRTPGFRKLLHGLVTVVRIARARRRYGGDVLFYTPTPVGTLPVLRDVVLLLLCRPLFARTVFHFHCAGMTALLSGASGVRARLLRAAYGHPDVGIRLSQLADPDGVAVGARREVVIPNPAPPLTRIDQGDVTDAPVLLHVGLLSPEKGLFRLLEVSRRLHQQGLRFRACLVGDYSSAAVQADAEAFLKRYDLEDVVVRPGVLVGDAKAQAYQQAAVFCFLTSHDAEVYPLVLLEATQAGLPIVTTRWRAIPDMVDEGGNAFLVDPDDADQATMHVAALLTNHSMREHMSEVSRSRAAAELTVEQYWSRLDAVFASLRP